MRTRSKILLAALASLVVFAAAVSTASANRLAVNEQNFLAEWTDLIFGEGITIDCPATLKGSFHSRTITKTPGSLVGHVTQVIVAENECDSNAGSAAATVLDTLPWHITYVGFSSTGGLPNITGVELLLHDTAFEIFGLPFGISCLYEGDAGGIVNIASGVATTLRADETSAIPLQSGGFLCPEVGHFAGEAPVKSPDDDPITVTLV